jgi:Fe-S-cluster containining protein
VGIMTIFELIDKSIREGYTGTDNTCNGKCTKCGECCGTILPIDQEDADRIVQYVFKNKVFINRFILVMKGKLQCPYYNGNQEKGCSIYEARPKICRYYKCDKKGINLEEMKNMSECSPVDMWAFAEDIEKEMKKHYELNKKTRETIK